MNETVRTLSNRISAITHLSMEMAEDLQVIRLSILHTFIYLSTCKDSGYICQQL